MLKKYLKVIMLSLLTIIIAMASLNLVSEVAAQDYGIDEYEIRVNEELHYYVNYDGEYGRYCIDDNSILDFASEVTVEYAQDVDGNYTTQYHVTFISKGPGIAYVYFLGEDDEFVIDFFVGVVTEPRWYKDTDTGNWYYLDKYGYPETGFHFIKNNWYYMNDEGIMQTYWTNVYDTWYYMNKSGVMQTGWNKVGKAWYYLDEDEDIGRMQTGWLKNRGSWYLLAKSGAMLTGWQKVKGTWYYLDKSGAMQTGWLQEGGNWYFLKANGAMQTGNVKINNKWYFFDSSGRMR